MIPSSLFLITQSVYQLAWQLSHSGMYRWLDIPVVTREEPGGLKDETAFRRSVSACPEGHPLPTLPTKWFDGIAWRDGGKFCRHCYEARTAKP
jgi:hypothetical protein